ncbi:IclR family transcriptional regulator [Mycobacterium decipiens]|uniref:Glycerol operon regulatory protein n=2 Tax=Mycobacterium decipiens TaxID=1430326 RepID=A0A1X2LPE8_9MYCO|nr:IclR family transcriptional regulator [Mycobacterium decipiens]
MSSGISSIIMGTGHNGDTQAGEPDTVPTVQSVDRALTVLELLAEMGKGGVTEIADELGVHKSTASRLITALESRGYVEQLSERGKYQLGIAVSRLARSRSGHLDLVKLSQDACDKLAADLGETANLAILDENRTVNIVEAVSTAEIALQSWVGQSCPAHATSAGKVLLAGLAADEVRERIGTSLDGFTDNTIVTIAALEAELAATRKAGWASACEELEIGLNAVAAPVRDGNGQVVAALSVSGPAYRLEASDFEEIAKRTIAAADGVSRGLGWTDRAS